MIACAAGASEVSERDPTRMRGVDAQRLRKREIRANFEFSVLVEHLHTNRYSFQIRIHSSGAYYSQNRMQDYLVWSRDLSVLKKYKYSSCELQIANRILRTISHRSKCHVTIRSAKNRL